jgi:hypothetical protein
MDVGIYINKARSPRLEMVISMWVAKGSCWRGYSVRVASNFWFI